MNQLNQNWQPHTHLTNLSSQSFSSLINKKQDLKSEERYQKAKIIFNNLYPELINEYYNWYLAINPDNNDYFFEREYLKLFEKLQQQKEKGKMVIFRLNETGVCGRI
jgi:hypothetical protein